MIIVSGIPGSGKTKLGESLTKLLSAEGLQVYNFKIPGHIQDQLKFTTPKYVSQILQFRDQTLAELAAKGKKS